LAADPDWYLAGLYSAAIFLSIFSFRLASILLQAPLS